MGDSPCPKRVCQKATPKGDATTSTPVRHNLKPQNLGRKFDSAMGTDEVRVDNVPFPFLQRNFVKFLDKVRVKNNIEPDVTSSVISCRCFNRSKNSVIVQFVSESIAMAITKLLKVDFMNSSISFHRDPIFDASMILNEPLASDIGGEEPLASDIGEEEPLAMSLNNDAVYFEETIREEHFSLLNISSGPAGNDYQDDKVVTVSETEDDNNNDKVVTVSETEDDNNNDKVVTVSETEDDNNNNDIINSQHNYSFNLTNVSNALDITSLGLLDDERQNCNQYDVEITNLPEGFSEENVSYELLKALWKKTTIRKPTRPIISCLRASETVARVKFDSVEHAEIAAGLQNIEYDDLTVEVKIIKIVEAPKIPTCTVQVTGLPPNFSLENVSYELLKALWKKTTITKPTRPIISCLKESETVAKVQFDSVVHAEIAAGLKNIEYDDLIVAVKIIKIVEAPKIPTSTIEVTGLSPNFSVENVSYELLKALWKKTTIRKPTRPIISCLRASETVARVKFDSVEHAEIAAGLQNIEYDDFLVKLSHIFQSDDALPPEKVPSQVDQWPVDQPDIQEAEDYQNAVLQSSITVKVSNLPRNFDKKNFISFLNKKMVEANFTSADCVDDVTCTNEPGVAIARFSCCEEANLACLLEDVVFLCNKLGLVKICEEGSTSFSSVVANTSLESDKGMLEFMKLLIKKRNSFGKSSNHDVVLEEIRKKLAKKGVCASLLQLRVKRRNVRDAYKRRLREGKSSHESIAPCRVIFDNEDLSVIKDTKYNPENDSDVGDEDSEEDTHCNDLLKFSNVAVWTVGAIKALIGVLMEKHDDFIKPVRGNKFWRDVSKEMTNKKYFYHGHQCERKLADLKCVYKNYTDDVEYSGAEGPIYDKHDESSKQIAALMKELMHGSVTIKPKFTVAGGLQSQERSSNEDASSTSTARRGITRPTVLKRKTSLAERKVAAMEKKAEAFLKISKKLGSVDNLDDVPSDD